MMPSPRWVWILLMVALALGLIVARWARSSRQRRDVNAIMASLANRAVTRAAAEFATELDYTPGSVERVEAILDRLDTQFQAGQLPEERASDEAGIWGAYIGEVIRRLKGGYWERDHAAAGPASFPIHYEGHASFPCAWCWKRIHNGAEDNVWHKFQLLTLGQDEGGMVFDGTGEDP